MTNYFNNPYEIFYFPLTVETPVHCAIKKHGCLQKNKQRRDCRQVLKILKHYNANFSAKVSYVCDYYR